MPGLTSHRRSSGSVPESSFPLRWDPGTVPDMRPSGTHPITASRDERYRSIFEGCTDEVKKTIHYKKTSVLMLSWDGEETDMENVDSEVARLADVFQDLYGFEVEIKTFKGPSKCPQRPDLQCKKHLADFVHEHNIEDSLLIIYYAGHGFRDADLKDSDLLLAGTLNHKDRPTKKRKRHDIVWSEVESAILRLDSDVLLIFDCCDAGSLGQIRGQTHTNFEILGSCAPGATTRYPGEGSFTSALIWALSELVKDKSAFDTRQLVSKIHEHDHFPSQQIPTLAYRHQLGEHTVLASQKLAEAALESGEVLTKARRSEQMRHKESIDIRLHFARSVDDETVKRTAENLKEKLDNDSHVEFLGVHSPFFLVAQSVIRMNRHSKSLPKINASVPVVELTLDTSTAVPPECAIEPSPVSSFSPVPTPSGDGTEEGSGSNSANESFVNGHQLATPGSPRKRPRLS